MTRIPVANRPFVTLAALLFMAAFLAVSSHAQTQDFAIMINGPWQFVVALDPNEKDANGNPMDRLFVVAPYHPSHVAYFWPSTDASMDDWIKNNGANPGQVVISTNGPASGYQKNVYDLDFPDNTARQFTNALPEENELVYQASTNVLPSTIQNVLYPSSTSIQRYAISLPLPDFTRTYSGQWVPAVAEAKVGQTDPGPSVPWSSYSTWTVLHYEFKNGKLPSQMNIQLNGKQANPISASQPNGDSHYGISIALMAAPLCPAGGYYPTCNFPQPPLQWSDNPECDSLSGLSFALAAKMWGLPEYARFPVEKDANGNQESGNYDYKCPAASQATLDEIATLVNLRGALTTLENLVGVNLQYRTSMSQRPAVKHGDQTALTTTFGEISSGLTTLFDSHVPDNVATDFDCACKNEGQSGCTLPVTPSPACTDKGTVYVEALEKSLKPFTGGDKGSSDCHSPQISINRAIQPQP
jgi:hypothetical protein